MERASLVKEGYFRCTQRLSQIEKIKPRAKHTGVVVGNKIVYIGGQSSDARIRYSDVWTYDLETKEFEEIAFLTGTPPKQSRHVAVAIGNLIYVFGGYDGLGNFWPLYVVDIAKREWLEPPVYGELPPPRSNAVACAVGKKIYLLGGSNGNTLFWEMHIFDTEKMEWSVAQVKGQIPEPRSCATMTAFGKLLYLFGGGVWDDKLSNWTKKFNEVSIFDTESESWSAPNIRSNLRPSVGTNASAFGLGAALYVYGGGLLEKKSVTKDCFRLDLVSLEWTTVKVENLRLIPERDSNTANVVANGELVCIFAGNCGSVLSDFVTMKVLYKPLKQLLGSQ